MGITEDEYQKLFQTGVTPEMLGVESIALKKKIWNAAIEAAAKIAENRGWDVTADKIRELNYILDLEQAKKLHSFLGEYIDRMKDD